MRKCKYQAFLQNFKFKNTSIQNEITPVVKIPSVNFKIRKLQR